jgi:hypothetical protein
VGQHAGDALACAVAGAAVPGTRGRIGARRLERALPRLAVRIEPFLFYEEHTVWVTLQEAPTDRVFVELAPRKHIDLRTRIY